jgi:outer membrane scaffolding protein for murein synthesis (MipA/OmpV family)
VRFVGAFVSVLLIAESASAGRLLDYIREYDLNDYALGVAVATRQSPYVGGENATVAYPYLTSFTHSAFTDGWLLIRDGGYGVRWVTDNDWELGAIGRIRTFGLGNSQAEDLIGITDRKWTIELGPTIGYRGWPVHINSTTYTEVTDRHEGFVSELAFSLPIEFDRGFVVPAIKAVYQSSDYTGYYYSVSEAEATPTRPAYTPASAINTVARVRLGYALTEKWLLSGTLGVDFLDSEITSSPIVERDRVWFGTIGLAYNANAFNPTAFDNYTRRAPDFDIRVGAFQSNINSKLARDTADGIPGFEVDLEDILGAPDEETVLQVDATWRIGQHHQLEVGFFELVRDGRVTLDDNLTFGDQVFAASTQLDSRIDYSSLRLGYTFFLVRDAQKELGVMAGVHFSDFSTDIVAEGTGQTERSRSNTPLPVIGVSGAVFLGEKTTLSARIHIFRTDSDQHEGSLNHATLDLEHRLGDRFSVGLGYNYYGVKLSSSDDGLNGDLKIRHHGPVVFLAFGF